MIHSSMFQFLEALIVNNIKLNKKMKNINIKTTAIFAFFITLVSCSNNPLPNNSTSNSSSNSSSNGPPENSRSSVREEDPYEVMHVAFEGMPAISTIKPMIEAIMDRYNMPKTNDNILKVGNMLVSMRQTSTVGLTEIELLKHIYQHGSDRVTLAQQAGISATLLETSK